jgi:hypothetical protein
MQLEATEDLRTFVEVPKGLFRRQAKDREDLHYLHDAFSELYQSYQDAKAEAADAALKFPEPPIPGWGPIVPVSTPRKLRAEGREMHHCVASYKDYVLQSKSYIYHIEMDDGEVGTLELGKSTSFWDPQPSDGWRIIQLRGKCNADVSPEMQEAVECWLERFPLEQKQLPPHR